MNDPAFITPEAAEEYTQSLGQIVGGSWRQIAWASEMGIPEALGLTTADWVEQRLGGYVRLSVSERREAAKELTAPAEDGGKGMTGPEAAEVLGVSDETVYRDLGKRSINVEPQGADRQEEAAESTFVETAPELPTITPPSDSESAPKAGAHVGKNTGDNEWYTPAEYIKAAVEVMGAVNLDPASSVEANEVVGGASFYTEEDDGLTQPWAGRIWMNPPYAQPWIAKFCQRLAREYASGEVTEAVVLVNNATETAWFQFLDLVATASCRPAGRIKFWHPRKEATPLQGQMVLYLGSNVAAFRRAFSAFGSVSTGSLLRRGESSG